MAGKSKIEWCTDSWNPTVGCSVISAGCTNCYAMKMAQRLTRIAQQHCETVCRLEHEPHALDHYVGTTKLVNGKPVWTGKIALAPEHIITVPLRWKRPRKIFVNSMSDLFHESIPDEWIDRIFAVMAMTYDTAELDENKVVKSFRQRHVYQVLTKRAKRMRDYVTALHGHAKKGTLPLDHPFAEAVRQVSRALGHPFWMNAPLTAWSWVAGGCPGLWLGVSCEDQARADERIPELLKTPAAIRFISAEPLLGAIDLTNVPAQNGRIVNALDPNDALVPVGGKRLDWVIVGGESGQGARPMVIGWAKEIVRQCKAAGVPCFVKQLGAKPANCEGQPHAISDRKGAVMAEWPEELRVREMPKGGL